MFTTGLHYYSCCQKGSRINFSFGILGPVSALSGGFLVAPLPQPHTQPPLLINCRETHNSLIGV